QIAPDKTKRQYNQCRNNCRQIRNDRCTDCIEYFKVDYCQRLHYKEQTDYCGHNPAGSNWDIDALSFLLSAKIHIGIESASIQVIKQIPHQVAQHLGDKQP